MELVIITPAKKDIIEIIWVELNTSNGNYIIQPGHAPSIFMLSEKKPLIYCLKNGKQEIVMIERAMAEVTRRSVTVLMN